MRLVPSLVATLVLLVATACGPKVPPRPASLPTTAVWAGEKGQGVFVVLGGQKGIGWSIKVYDRQGNLVKDAVFHVQGMARAEIFATELKGWDGSALLLEDGGRLVSE